ncbi:hypothetical protein LJC56_00835 [Christensenellaceae bacterium OttesenSCG-928-K19]|nr:hypothetical protein [Christensenellaceae bacterium OttesenSCG-928-K19]
MKYKVIIREPVSGMENYIDDLTKAKAIEEAAKQAADAEKRIYVEWTDSKEQSGYLNRDGGMDCPGEPW